MKRMGEDKNGRNGSLKLNTLNKNSNTVRLMLIGMHKDPITLKQK